MDVSSTLRRSLCDIRIDCRSYIRRWGKARWSARSVGQKWQERSCHLPRPRSPAVGQTRRRGDAAHHSAVHRRRDPNQEPTFDSGEFLQYGEIGLKINIDVGSRATPTIADWNSDGKKDLVVGSIDGKIHIFLNKNTDAEPDFVFRSFALEDYLVLVVPGLRSSPEILDLDSDGRKDILTGNTNGQLLLYSNVGTDKEPLFSGYVPVDSNAVEIDLGGNPRS